MILLLSTARGSTSRVRECRNQGECPRNYGEERVSRFFSPDARSCESVPSGSSFRVKDLKAVRSMKFGHWLGVGHLTVVCRSRGRCSQRTHRGWLFSCKQGADRPGPLTLKRLLSTVGKAIKKWPFHSRGELSSSNFPRSFGEILNENLGVERNSAAARLAPSQPVEDCCDVILTFEFPATSPRV